MAARWERKMKRRRSELGLEREWMDGCWVDVVQEINQGLLMDPEERASIDVSRKEGYLC